MEIECTSAVQRSAVWCNDGFRGQFPKVPKGLRGGCVTFCLLTIAAVVVLVVIVPREKGRGLASWVFD